MDASSKQSTVSEWTKVTTPAFLVCTTLTLLLAYFSNTGSMWIPILDSANLMFHEAGHPIFGLLSDRLMVYGGTLGQLTFPLVTFVRFLRQKNSVAAYLCFLWFVQNLWNISTYLADARAQVLPLIGGGEHDWTEILTRWNCLQNDTQLSRQLIFLGLILIFIAWHSLFQHWKSRKIPLPNADSHT